MFFTDHITEYCKNFEITRSIKDREKSIFSGMELNFLDFYMRAICRTFKAIQRVPLKSMKEITGKGTDEEIKIPLQDKIYLVYLGLSSAGGITQKKKQYRDFCENLEIKDKLKNSTV
jgi:hypothetical protein